ncbi:MAG: PEP/pyruvate-binding domain-containing protein [Candidatus Orphnella occulta]|nr:PEP/pyruvate-binding domain-containing protein [Candidatus Orphnella occulta]
MFSTGIKGLDETLKGLRAGDNVVWQIDDIADYIDLVRPFVKQAQKEEKKVIYVRFASHKELLRPSEKIKRYQLDAHEGFESFATKVNTIITEEGLGAYYVFDCLSGLLSAWATDLMIGNFFMVTCPYLYELKTVTYFSIMRNNHSFDSIARIRETTQLLIDVYHCEGNHYVHPLKVWNRYSPTMFLPHQREGDTFIPITDSVNAVKILSYIREKGTESTKRNLDYWDRLFMDASKIAKSKASAKSKKDTIDRLCNLMLTKNKEMLALVTRYLSLDDLIDIKSRLIGTGFIGGKAVGMFLARKMLSAKQGLNWESIAEGHDSFYIGSDIFYSYIVQNRWWKLRVQQKTEQGYLNIAQILKEKILHGSFSQEIMEHFQQIIEYFGSSPIIIRSSSLLEDGFGNAFAGKYESVFLANQGSPEQRYIEFADAVRRIYASTMSEDALVYRKQRGLDKMDEQMALLIQRVSGADHKGYFFPDIAGVGVSHNTYVWNDKMNPEAGMLRLVSGLGTRAVDRVEGDYPRMVALEDPLARPYSEKNDLRKFSQHALDLININNNRLETIPFPDIIAKDIYPEFSRIAEKDYDAICAAADRGIKGKEYWILTFDKLFADTQIAKHFKDILKTLEQGYNYPVEIEFTLNFTHDDSFKINLLQCRPLQTWGVGKKTKMPKVIDEKDTIFSSTGYFLGGNIAQQIRRVIYIDPKEYIKLPLVDKYEVARNVGRLNKSIKSRGEQPTLLMGPGRWGTTTPSLGVPVKFAEINNVIVLAEVAFPAGHLMPELSFGTHFFQDLVETNIFYVALFPDKDQVVLNQDWFNGLDNILAEQLPQAEKYKDCIRVYDLSKRDVKIISDTVSQKIVCFQDQKKTKNETVSKS